MPTKEKELNGHGGPQNKKSRSSRPATVHECALSGDLATFKKMIQGNPLLLHERNPIMAQTPLHASAANNRVEIMKFLLDQHGMDKVELDAKNMFGETPLHMAAKNGSSEAAQLLLTHGASVESRANNGMTPLHIAVWSSSMTDTLSTVTALLEYNADCCAKDDDGSTPLNLLPPGSGSRKLRELLLKHLEEQKRRRALEACQQSEAKMQELENALSNIVGLHEVKIQLRKWTKGMLLDEKRKSLGLKVGSRKLPHMAFLGNPGTGKTMVARMLGRILHMVGVLPTDKVTEVQRTDLVGQFVGHTGPKTRKMITEAEGGILFVDEAYQLIPIHKSDDKDYGIEALEEIMSVMDSGKIVVIFAGYSEPMKRVIASNEGFCRRVTKFFHFNDFSYEDLAQIAHIKMNSQEEDGPLYGFKLHPLCTLEAIAALIEKETTEKKRRQMNGGLVDTMLVNARENLDLRLDFNCIDAVELCSLKLEDLEAGLRLLMP